MSKFLATILTLSISLNGWGQIVSHLQSGSISRDSLSEDIASLEYIGLVAIEYECEDGFTCTWQKNGKDDEGRQGLWMPSRVKEKWSRIWCEDCRVFFELGDSGNHFMDVTTSAEKRVMTKQDTTQGIVVMVLDWEQPVIVTRVAKQIGNFRGIQGYLVRTPRRVYESEDDIFQSAEYDWKFIKPEEVVLFLKKEK